MGILRLALAVSVIFSHSPIGAAWWRPLIGGSLAVQIFFMISGFYMALVLTTKYREPDGSIALGHFWLARALRIYPAYWIVAAVTLAYFIFTRSEFFVHLKQIGLWFALWAVFSNVTLLGLDGLFFVKVTDAGVGLVDTLGRAPVPQPYHLGLIAPAWTLSLELMFYLMAPFTVRLRTAGLVSLFAASLGARAIAYQIGFAEDPWTYRFLPFELGLFLAGMLAHRVYIVRIMRGPWFAVALAFLMVVFPFLPQAKLAGFSMTGSLLLIVAWLALPAVFAWRKDSDFDRAIGDVSYPVYIVHLPLLIMLSPYISAQSQPYLFTAVAIGLSIIVGAALGVFVERFVAPRIIEVFRRKSRAPTAQVGMQPGPPVDAWEAR